MTQRESHTPMPPRDVLIVEDSPTQAAVLRNAMAVHGWTVRAAGDGHEALAMARSRKPAIVVSDIRMPGMDGYTLARTMKGDPELRDIPVVLLTSLTESQDIVHAINSRADYYFLKQWDYDVLIEKIASALDCYQASAQPDQATRTVCIDGVEYTIEPDARQPLGLLLSTYAIAVQQASELARSRDELREHRDHLERLVAERTAALRAEIEERKLLEECLRKHARELRYAQEIAQVGSWSYCPATRRFEWSDCMFSIWGVAPKAGAPTFAEQQRLVHPDDRPRLVAALEKAVNSGCSCEMEFRICRADGGTVTVAAICEPQRDEAGTIVALRGTNQDITERRARECQQRLAMQVLNVLNRRNDIASLVEDIVGLIKESLEFDVVAVRLCPKGDAEAVGDDCASLQSPLLEDLARRVVTGRLLPGEGNRTEQGSFWTNCASQLPAAEPVAGPDGRPYESMALIPLQSADRVVGLLQLSDQRPERLSPEMVQFLEELAVGIGIALGRKRAAEDMQSVARFPAENPDPVLRIAADGTVLYANPAARERFAAWQPRSGRPAPAELREIVEQALASGKAYAVDAQYGSQTFSFTATPILADEYVNIYCRDITDRLELESQLRQSQKLESIGRLAGGVAHDFNNMLAIILGHAEMILEDTPPDAAVYEDLKVIHDAARRSADLTRQLLAFARKQVVEPAVLDLNATVEGMLKLLRRLLGEGIELDWQPSAELWQIHMDPSQIDQILANLCVNARDAMASQGELIIETENSVFDADYCASHSGTAPGEYVRLSVSDTGCGMDRETLARIFDPFFTTKGLGQGTGLGLATVYGAVKQNHGFINAYSELGRGTTFTIYLPRHHGAEECSAPADTSRPMVRGDETILLVEDETATLRMATLMLQRQGYTVLSVAAPGEALALARDYSGRIDLLMSDVIMPEMDGRALAREVEAIRPGIRSLFMSGYTANVIVRHGVLDRGVFFIQKPFTISALSQKVRDVLGSLPPVPPGTDAIGS